MIAMQTQADSDNSIISAHLFDMDNTLFDLVGAQVAACQAVVRHLGKDDGDALFAYFLRGVRGFEDYENILDYMTHHDIESDVRFHEACRIYDDAKLHCITPYLGVPETLITIKAMGYRMGLITDVCTREADLRLSKTGLFSLFDFRLTFDITKKKKPSPSPFLLALDRLGTPPSETLLIGDSLHRDIEPGRSLGMRIAYARYGDRFAAQREKVPADFVLDRIDELPKILVQHVTNGR